MPTATKRTSEKKTWWGSLSLRKNSFQKNSYLIIIIIIIIIIISIDNAGGGRGSINLTTSLSFTVLVL